MFIITVQHEFQTSNKILVQQHLSPGGHSGSHLVDADSSTENEKEDFNN